MWPEAHGLRLRRTVRPAGRPGGRLNRGVPRRVRFDMFFFAWLAQGPDAGEGAPEDVLGAWIIARQSAAGLGQAPEIVGGRLGGEFEVDGFAFDGPEAVETPGGGADFLDCVLLDDVARGDRQHLLADQFLEAFARLFLTTVVLASRSRERALMEERGLRCPDLGPRERAPLARDAAC